MQERSRLIARPVRRHLAPRRARRPLDKASPIVKWVGGKTKLLDELTSRRPVRFRRYFEPFVGGGALFFHLAPSSALLSDLNEDLIATYRAVASNVEGVIRLLQRHRSRHDTEYYYQVRERWNDRARPLSEVARAAAFIYLNKTCYNGLWRVNRKGGFNVPVGRYDSPSIFDAEQLRAASRLLARTQLRAAPYAAVLDEARAGDFVYFDPPYHPLTETANFTSYTSPGFTADDQRALAEVARTLARRGCAVMLSNSDTPLIRELYRDFRVEQVLCARAINSKASARGAITELVITSDYA